MPASKLEDTSSGEVVESEKETLPREKETLLRWNLVSLLTIGIAVPTLGLIGSLFFQKYKEKIEVQELIQSFKEKLKDFKDSMTFDNLENLRKIRKQAKEIFQRENIDPRIKESLKKDIFNPYEDLGEVCEVLSILKKIGFNLRKKN